MNIKFCTNSISTKSKMPNFSDLVKAAQTKAAMTKSASTAAPAVKTAAVKLAEKEGTNEEGKDSGQPKAEAKLVNDPHKDPKIKEEKKASEGAAKSDEAESSGQLDVEPLHQEGESTGDKPGDLDTQKDKKEKSAQSVLHKFVRVANLTGTQKEFLRKTWSLYYPKSFIDALLADR